MSDPTAFRLFGELQKKLPLIGQAVGEALMRITSTAAGRYGFAVFIFDPETQNLAFTTNMERASLHAALSEHLSHQSH